MNSPELLVSVPEATLREALGEVPDGVKIIEWDMSGPAPIETIDIVVPPYQGTTRKLAQLERVQTRLVQSQSIGYDGVKKALPPGHVFANAATVHEAST